MAERTKFTPRVEDILRRVDLAFVSDILVGGMRAMSVLAEKCNLHAIFHVIEDTQRLHSAILGGLDKAVVEGRISREERNLVADELSRIRGSFMEETIRILGERCGCKWRRE